MAPPDRSELLPIEMAERILVGAMTGEAATNPSGIASIFDGIKLLVEARRQSAEQDDVHAAEAEAILHRVDRDLAVEEALTRELMARHGL